VEHPVRAIAATATVPTAARTRDFIWVLSSRRWNFIVIVPGFTTLKVNVVKA
jgi:hypothetical protein